MRKIIIIAIIAICLVAVFYPKNAGKTCGMCLSYPAVQREEYSCIGFKQDINPEFGCADCGIKIVCYGIVTNEKKCYSYINNNFGNLSTEVECEFPVK